MNNDGQPTSADQSLMAARLHAERPRYAVEQDRGLGFERLHPEFLA
jgi:hypothetical protein